MNKSSKQAPEAVEPLTDALIEAIMEDADCYAQTAAEDGKRPRLERECLLENLRALSHPLAVEPPLLRDFAGSTEDALRMALQMLYDDTADYIQRNNLGAMNNHAMRLAREALSRPSAPVVESEARFALENIAFWAEDHLPEDLLYSLKSMLPGHQSEAVAQAVQRPVDGDGA